MHITIRIASAVLSLALAAASSGVQPSVTRIASGEGEKDRFGNTIALSKYGLASSSLYAWNKHGAVSLYDLSGDGYQLSRRIVGHLPFGAFGRSVAQGNHYVAVGAPAEMCYNYQGGQHADCGAVYVFNRNQTTQEEEVYPTRLTPKEKDHPSAQFGMALVSSGNFIFVGAPGMDDRDGEVQLYERAGSEWTAGSKLYPPESGYKGGFGASLALNEDSTLLAVGAPDDICTISGWLASGAVHMFARDPYSDQWMFAQTLFPQLPLSFMRFGETVAIYGGSVVAGAPNGHGAHATNAGVAFVYSLVSQTTFSQNAQLLANDGSSGDGFGCSVAVDSVSVVVGACYEAGKMNKAGEPLQVADGAVCGSRSPSSTDCYTDSVHTRGNKAGAVYVYKWDAESSEAMLSNDNVVKVLPPQSGDGWYFGSAVAARKGRIVIGARGAASESTHEVGAIFDLSFTAQSVESDIAAAFSSSESSGVLFKGFAYIIVTIAIVSIAVVLVLPAVKFAAGKLGKIPCDDWSSQAVEQPMTMRRSSPSEHGLLASSEHASEVSTRGLTSKNLFAEDVEAPTSDHSLRNLPIIHDAPISGSVEQYGTTFSDFGVVNSSQGDTEVPPGVADWGVEEYEVDKASQQKGLIASIVAVLR